jgi:predicted nuclease with TOPRIM domain
MPIVIDAGCKNPARSLKSLSVNQQYRWSGILKTKNQKMKKLIMKLLGLNTLVEELALLQKQNEELTNRVKHLDDEVNALEEKVDEIEIPDMDDYVAHSDLDDNIESYLNNNDYATTSYVDDEIESKVSDAIDDADIDAKVESAIEDLDIEEKVRDLFNDASPAPMSEEAIKDEVSKAIAEVLSKAYDHLKKQG